MKKQAGAKGKEVEYNEVISYMLSFNITNKVPLRKHSNQLAKRYYGPFAIEREKKNSSSIEIDFVPDPKVFQFLPVSF